MFKEDQNGIYVLSTKLTQYVIGNLIGAIRQKCGYNARVLSTFRSNINLLLNETSKHNNYKEAEDTNLTLGNECPRLFPSKKEYTGRHSF